MIKSRSKMNQELQIEPVGAKNAVDIFCGAHCSWYLNNKGELFGFGLNTKAQLGIGYCGNESVPKFVYALKGQRVKQVAGGEHHGVLVTESGSVWTWGCNDEGQCGQGNLYGEYLEREKARIAEQAPVEEEKEAKKTPKSKKAKATNEETELESIKYFRKPHQVESLSNISQVYAAGDYCYAYDRHENQLYTWGFNANSTLLSGKENTYEPRPVKMKFFNEE